MPENRFKYYLRANSLEYYILSGGSVITTPVKTPFNDDPIEWNTIELKWARNSRYHGVMRSFALPATFAGDAANILRHIYYTQGYNGVCYLDVEMRGEDTPTYSLFYTGSVDFFGQYVDNDVSVQVAIVDANLAALLKTKEDTTYEIPIYDADCRYIKMDGVKLRNRAYYTVTADTMEVSSTFSRQMSPAQTMTTSEAPYISDLETSRTEQVGSSSFLAANNFIYTASYAGIVTVGFEGVVRMFRTIGMGATTGALRVAIFKNGAAQTLHNIYAGAPFTAAINTETVPYTEISITVAVGDTLTLIIGSEPIVNASPATNDWAFTIVSPGGGLPAAARFNIAFYLRNTEKTIRAHRQVTVWEKIIAAMSGGLYGFVSSYLNNTTLRNWGNNPYNTLLTSGDAARGLGSGVPATSTTKPAVIKTSIRDLFADGNGRDMVGLGIDGSNIRVERLDYFYNNGVVTFDLGVVSNFRKGISNETIFNLLKTGYVYDSNDALNGKQDPHTTFQYGTDAIHVKKELTQVSPFVASMYAWEFKRVNLDGKNTTDDSGDNAVMIVEVSDTLDASGRHLLYRPQNDAGNSVSGIEAADTAFNLTLMPEYNLRRNGAILHTGTHLMDGTDLHFQSAQQNDKVISKLHSLLPTVTANAAIPVTDLDDPLWLPIPFEFDTAVPSDFKDAVEFNPYGRVQFIVIHPKTDKRIALAGFIDEVMIKPGNNGVCSWKLFAAPDTDLTDLIF